MDQPCSYDDLRDCLRDIARVNRLTRAYHPTLRWLDYFYATLPLQQDPIHIVDVGCGYGDMLRRVARWASDRNLPVILTGIDLNPNAVRAAREATLPGTITFLAGNAYDFDPPGGIDLVISSLLTHHLEDYEIVDFLAWMESVSHFGWFINDLHRQATPYHLFRLLSRFTDWHPFVKNDGPVSILRSFRPDDWHHLLRSAGIPLDEVLITEHRPARLCVARLR
jgi:SAM-dependent methyltransferase